MNPTNVTQIKDKSIKTDLNGSSRVRNKMTSERFSVSFQNRKTTFKSCVGIHSTGAKNQTDSSLSGVIRKNVKDQFFFWILSVCFYTKRICVLLDLKWMVIIIICISNCPKMLGTKFESIIVINR
jgi:hypothetical protein